MFTVSYFCCGYIICGQAILIIPYMDIRSITLHLNSSELCSLCRVENVMSYTFMVQIQVRLCLLETSCEQADHFPAFCSLKVNGSQVFSVSSDSIVLPTQIGKYTVHQTRDVYARQVKYSILLRSSPFKPREYLDLFLFCCYFTLMFSIHIRISPY